MVSDGGYCADGVGRYDVGGGFVGCVCRVGVGL